MADRRRVLEELCTDSNCPRETTHWHPFSVDSFLKERVGQYTITVRVREIMRKNRSD